MKIKTIYCSVAIILLLQMGCSAGKSTPEESLQKSQSFIEAQDYDSARIELLAAVSAYPSSAELRFALSKIQLKFGNFGSAEKELLKAEELGIPASETQPILAETLFRQYRYQDLIALDKDLAENMSPEDEARVFALTGLAFTAKGNDKAAESRFKHALDVAPNSALAMVGMSGLAWKRNQPEEMLDWATKATVADPESSDSWAALANARTRSKQPEQALRAMDKAIEQRFYPNPLLAERALLLIEQQEYLAARSDIEALEQSAYKDYWYLEYARGRLEYAEGDYESAVVSFSQAMNKIEVHGLTKLYAALAHYQLGNYEQARVLATEAANLMPGRKEPVGLLAQVLVGIGDSAEATRLLGHLLEVDPENIAALRLQGMSLIAMGQYEEGISLLERLLRISPEAEGVEQALMLARIRSGADINEIISKSGDLKSDYEKQFWMAYERISNGDTVSAREIAMGLQSSYPDRTDPLKIIALSYFQEKDWENAVPAFAEIARQSPDEPVAMKNLTVVQIAAQDKQAAIATLDDYMDKYGDQTDAALFAYRQYLALGESERAGEIVEKAFSENPNDSVLRRAIIYREFLSGNYNSVLRLLQGIDQAELNKNSRLLEVAGLSQHRTGNDALALKSFERLALEQPKNIRAQLLYAEALAEAGENNAADKAYKQALALDQNNYNTSIRYISFLIAAEKYVAAQDALNSLSESVGEKPDMLFLQGRLDLLSADLESAKINLTQSFQLRPSAGTAILLSRANLLQGDFTAAIDALDLWLTDHSDDLIVMMEKAGVFLSQNKEEHAIDIYKDIVELYPESVPALNNLAWLSRESDPEYAMGMINRARQLQPNDPAILDTLGYLLLEKGESQQALTHLELANELSPGNPDIKLHLARALIENDQQTKARRLLSEVTDDTSTETTRNRAQLMLDSME